MEITIENSHFSLGGYTYQIETALLSGKTPLTHDDFMALTGQGIIRFFDDGGYLAIKRAFRDLDYDRIVLDVR